MSIKAGAIIEEASGVMSVYNETFEDTVGQIFVEDESTKHMYAYVATEVLNIQ